MLVAQSLACALRYSFTHAVVLVKDCLSTLSQLQNTGVVSMPGPVAADEALHT